MSQTNLSVFSMKTYVNQLHKLKRTRTFLDQADKFKWFFFFSYLVLQVIHVAIVCAGFKETRRVVTLIKSILFYRKQPLHFHFVSDTPGRLVLETLFNTWKLQKGLFVVDVIIIIIYSFLVIKMQTSVLLYPPQYI